MRSVKPPVWISFIILALFVALTQRPNAIGITQESLYPRVLAILAAAIQLAGALSLLFTRPSLSNEEIQDLTLKRALARHVDLVLSSAGERARLDEKEDKTALVVREWEANLETAERRLSIVILAVGFTVQLVSATIDTSIMPIILPVTMALVAIVVWLLYALLWPRVKGAARDSAISELLRSA